MNLIIFCVDKQIKDKKKKSDLIWPRVFVCDHLCQVRSSSRKVFLLALRPPTGVRGSLGSDTNTEQGESDKALRSSPMEPVSAV